MTPLFTEEITRFNYFCLKSRQMNLGLDRFTKTICSMCPAPSDTLVSSVDPLTLQMVTLSRESSGDRDLSLSQGHPSRREPVSEAEEQCSSGFSGQSQHHHFRGGDP